MKYFGFIDVVKTVCIQLSATSLDIPWEPTEGSLPVIKASFLGKHIVAMISFGITEMGLDFLFTANFNPFLVCFVQIASVL